MKAHARWFGACAVVLVLVVVAAHATTVFEDQFNNPKSGWFVGTRINSTNAGAWSYTDDNQYRILITSKQRISWSEAPMDNPVSEFCLEVDLLQLQNPGLAREGEIGIFYGAQGKNGRAFTTIGLQPDGFMDIGDTNAVNDLTFNRIVDRAELDRVFDTRIIPRAPATNRLRVVAQGGQVEVFVNGKKALQYADSSVQGYVGVYGWAFDEPNLNARFDNFLVTTPDCQR